MTNIQSDGINIDLDLSKASHISKEKEMKVFALANEMTIKYVDSIENVLYGIVKNVGIDKFTHKDFSDCSSIMAVAEVVYYSLYEKLKKHEDERVRNTIGELWDNPKTQIGHIGTADMCDYIYQPISVISRSMWGDEISNLMVVEKEFCECTIFMDGHGGHSFRINDTGEHHVYIDDVKIDKGGFYDVIYDMIHEHSQKPTDIANKEIIKSINNTAIEKLSTKVANLLEENEGLRRKNSLYLGKIESMGAISELERSVKNMTSSFESTISELTKKLADAKYELASREIDSKELTTTKNRLGDRISEIWELRRDLEIMTKNRDALVSSNNRNNEIGRLMLEVNEGSLSIKDLLDSRFYDGELHRNQIEATTKYNRDTALSILRDIMSSNDNAVVDRGIENVKSLLIEIGELKTAIIEVPEIKSSKIGFGKLIETIKKLGEKVVDNE